MIGVLTWTCHFSAFSSRYTGKRCEHLGPTRAGLDWLWAFLGISLLLVAILTILLTRKNQRNKKRKNSEKTKQLLTKQNNSSKTEKEHIEPEQSNGQSEYSELNNRNSQIVNPSN